MLPDMSIDMPYMSHLVITSTAKRQMPGTVLTTCPAEVYITKKMQHTAAQHKA